MGNVYNRRHMIKWGLGGLTGLSAYGLTACSGTTPSASSTQTAPGPVGLHLYFWGSATRDKLTTQAMNLFHHQYADVTITSQYTDFNSYWKKLDAFISGGHTPDLIQMDMRYVSKYVRSGLMLDLTQLIYNQTIDLSDFDPLTLDGSKANNTVYGIPLGGNYQCLIYDTALTNRSGIGAPPDNMTWDQYATYANNLTKALGNGINGSGDSSGDMAVYEIWIRQRGKELYTDDGQLAFNVQDVTDWFDYWNQLRANGGCVSAAVQAQFSTQSGAASSALTHGKCAIVIPHTNEFESYQALAKDALALHAVPDGPGAGLYNKPSMLISISSTTPYVQECANFISFIINNPDGIKAIGVERGIPGSVKGLALLRPNFTAAQQQVVAFSDMIAASGKTRIKEVLDPPTASQVANLFMQISVDVSFLRTSATAGAQKFFTEAQKILA